MKPATLYRRQLSQRQRAIVRAPKGKRQAAAKALRDWNHAMLAAAVKRPAGAAA